MYKSKKAWLTVIALVVLVKIFAAFPLAVEKYYSNGIYPFISRLQRLLFGWVPFSMGDILYIVAGIYLLVKLVKCIRAIFKKRVNRQFWWYGLQWLLFNGLWVYTVFNICWGLNYNRLGMAYQMRLQMKPYTNEELKTVMEIVVKKLAETNSAALQTRNIYATRQSLFNESYQSYQTAKRQYPHLNYSGKSIKNSLFSYMGDYMGYTGYYNPFTGEAQVNTTVPVFVQPFTTCHEMGHQLGYAKENEANFAGYLSARSSADASFRYSVYFDLYTYGIRELYFKDSTAAISLNKKLPQQVEKDFKELRDFFDRYQNPVEPYIRKLYGQYLKANEQPTGMQSYSEVMAFLIAYYKKYGADAL
jgi:Protein of unknown function (DUF3810)